jgi:hypothetical protein
MDQDSDGKYLPRAPRFEVSDPCETVVTITRTGGADDEFFTAKLVDVSQHGAKLRVPVNLQFEESLQLNIEILGTELDYRGVASVRHIRSTESESQEESWVVGCAIAPPFTDETFSYLATTAGKERRRFRRLPIAAEATIRRQAQPDGYQATLHNLSSGGFCCSSEVHYEVGERIQLTIDDTKGKSRVIEARICWQVDGPDGSIVGCQFSSRSSYSEICACLTEQPIAEPRALLNSEPTSKLVLTAAILAMFLPPLMTLLLQAKQVSAEATRVPSFVEATMRLGDEANAAELHSNRETTATPAPGTGRLAENRKLATVGDEHLQKSESTQTRAAVQSPLRTWLDNTGKHQTEAKLIGVTPDYVVLQKPSGHDAQVPWRRLSEADRQYAQDWHARHP